MTAGAAALFAALGTKPGVVPCQLFEIHLGAFISVLSDWLPEQVGIVGPTL